MDRYGNAAVVVAVDERRGRATAANATGAHLFDVRDGAMIRSYAGMDGVAAIDERTGRVVVTAIGPRYPQGMGNPMGDGTASILDDESGAILRTVAVGLRPGLVAVDGRTGRAFVVNVGCPAPRLPCGPPSAPDRTIAPAKSASRASPSPTGAVPTPRARRASTG